MRGTGSRRPGAPTAIAAAVLLVLASGCGVPDDREPRIISAGEAPIDLDPADDETPATGDAEVTLYFVRERSLVTLSRSVETENLDNALRALLAGLTEAEAVAEEGRQSTTRIPPETELRSVTESGETATIDLGCTAETSQTPDCGILGLEGADSVLLFGQLVCTADAVPGISSVRVRQDGEPLDAPLPDAAPSAEPVRCFDYRPLFPQEVGSGSSDPDED